MATSSAECVRVFKEVGIPKYYQEVQPYEKIAGTALYSICK